MQSADQIKLFLIVSTLLILFLVALISIILFFYQNKRLDFMKHLERLKLDHEKNLLQTQLDIQEHTFQNISREIHDNISLSLTLAKLNLNTLNLKDVSRLRDSVERTVELISTAINDLSNISKSMNSEAICSHGLIAALQIEIDKIIRCGRHHVKFQINGDPVFMDPQRELVLFRISQEALNNVLKHANASNINLELHYHRESIDLLVEDDGIGFTPDALETKDKTMMAGLKNMANRAQLINGKCEILSEPARGTKIAIKAPI